MSRTVVVSITTSAFMAPAGTVPGGLRVTLGTEPPRVAMASKGDSGYVASIDVIGVPGGSYSVEAQAIDANGVGLGAAVSAFCTLQNDAAPAAPPAPVAEAQVSVDVPASLSVSVI